VLVLPALVNAQNAEPLPSRKASVVGPLLTQLSPNDPPKKVLAQLDKILGQPDSGAGGGPSSAYWTAKLYVLDDGTEIDIHSVNGKFVGVTLLATGRRFLKEFYHVPKTGAASN
jgi:hypothetical protein